MALEVCAHSATRAVVRLGPDVSGRGLRAGCFPVHIFMTWEMRKRNMHLVAFHFTTVKFIKVSSCLSCACPYLLTESEADC